MKHIVLVTYGEPTSAAFVDQLVYSWRILLGLTRTVADIPAPLIPLIALSRARGRNAMWRRNTYTSPLEPITLAQAAQLRDALARQSGRRSGRFTSRMNSANPLLATVINQISRNELVIVVPMYAADSAFTHNLSRQTVAGTGSAAGPAPVIVLPAIDVDRLARDLRQSRDAVDCRRHHQAGDGGAGAGGARHADQTGEADRHRARGDGAVVLRASSSGCRSALGWSATAG